MEEKKVKIKVEKLKKGSVSSHPEVVIILYLLKKIGAYDELINLSGKLFSRNSKERI